MVIFHSYVSLPEGKSHSYPIHHYKIPSKIPLKIPSNEITAVVFVVAFTLAAPTEQIRPVEKGACPGQNIQKVVMAQLTAMGL